MMENELAQALIKALTDNIPGRPDGFRTTKELIRDTGMNQNSVLQRLNMLKEEGRIEVQQIMVENLVGRYQPIWAYRLKNGQESD